MSARVNVIIPLYNHGPYIERAVASALAQSVPVTIFVADDGSTDDGPFIVERLAKSDSRVIAIPPAPRPRTGTSAARNRALARGSSEFVAFGRLAGPPIAPVLAACWSCARASRTAAR